MHFNERVIAVTGAGSGIGQEICRLFARRGCKIGLLGHNQSGIDTLADELCRARVRCFAAAADVGQRDQVKGALEEIAASLGPIDTIITCAGICRASTVDDLKVAEVEEIVRTNFLGMVYAIDAVLPSMLEHKRGHIVGISSLAGVRGIPFEPAYSASKAAVTAYLESLRPQLRQRRIHVTTVFPGYVRTPLLDGINELMGADMSNGNALTSAAAAARIVKAIERRSSYSYFPLALGLGVHLSQLLPPRLYDQVTGRMFSRFPISRLVDPEPRSESL